MSKTSTIVLLMLLFFWTLVIAGADYVVFSTAVLQKLSGRFATTEGRILRSEVTKRTILHAGITIQYAYSVNGKEHHGDRYRYDADYSYVHSDDIIARFPKWTTQKVYYNPNNPDDAVLSPGVSGIDLLLILFSTPVIILLILLWGWTMARLRERWRVPFAGGVRLHRQRDSVRVRLVETPALTAGLYGLGGASFAATFPVVVLIGVEPSTRSMEWVWGLVLLAGAAAFGWSALRNASGKFDLLIHHSAQTVTIHRTSGRSREITFPWGELSGVTLQRRTILSASGRYFSYLPALNRAETAPGPRCEMLSRWGWTEARARAFGEWLSLQLGIEFKGVEEEKPSPDAQPVV